MKCMNRYVLVCAAMFVALFAGVSYAAHMYYIGVLTSFSNNQMLMDGNEYPLSPNVMVILRVVGSNGAIHEKIGRLSDISVGNKVTIKVSNGEVTEVEKVVSR